MKRISWFCMVAVLLCAPVQLSAQENIRGIWDATASTYQTITWDLATGLPSGQCYMSDGAGTAITSTGGALDVNLASGSGSGLATEATLALIEGNTATGSAVDSSAVAQEASWRSVANPSGAADANKGSITAVVLGTVVKVYLLPAGKEFHSISIAMPDSDANDFDYTVQMFTGNSYPSAVFTLPAWMSVSSLVVPSLRLARDRTKLTVAQPVIRARDGYLMILVNTVATAPAGNPLVRVRSWNSGDEVL